MENPYYWKRLLKNPKLVKIALLSIPFLVLSLIDVAIAANSGYYIYMRLPTAL